MKELPPCKHHPDGSPLTVCPTCGNTVCNECVKAHGYYCSEACRNAELARETSEETLSEEEYEQQRQTMARMDLITTLVLKVVPTLILLLILLYIVLRFMDRSGTPRWIAQAQKGRVYTHLLHDGDRMYAMLSDKGIQALDVRNGNVLWNHEMEGGGNESHMLTPCPNGFAVFNYEELRLIEARSGELRWKSEIVGDSLSELTAGKEALLFASYDMATPTNIPPSTSMRDAQANNARLIGYVTALDYATGAARWKHNMGFRFIKRMKAFGDLCLVVNSEEPRSAFDLYSAIYDDVLDGATIHFSMDTDYVQETSNIHTLTALEQHTGKVRWVKTLPKTVFKGLFLRENRVLLLTQKGIFAYDFAGNRAWEAPLDVSAHQVEIGADKLVLSHMDGRLRCLDVAAGKEIWNTQTDGAIIKFRLSANAIYAVVDPGRRLAPQGLSEPPPLNQGEQMLRVMDQLQASKYEQPRQRSKPTAGRLTCFDLASGRRRWIAKKEKIRGKLYPHPKGVLLMWHSNSMGAAIMGKFYTYLDSYAHGNGKRTWQRKSEAPISLCIAGDDAIFIISRTPLAEKPDQQVSSILALQKRTTINRLTKF